MEKTESDDEGRCSILDGDDIAVVVGREANRIGSRWRARAFLSCRVHSTRGGRSSESRGVGGIGHCRVIGGKFHVDGLERAGEERREKFWKGGVKAEEERVVWVWKKRVLG